MEDSNMKELFGYSIKVDEEGYKFWNHDKVNAMTQEEFEKASYEELLDDIPDLDKVIITHPVTFELNYPFPESYNCTIDCEEITLRMIIDAIRVGFRIMYKGADIQPIAGMINMSVTSPEYGHAMHVIGDLVIERLYLNKKDNSLYVGIGS